MDESQLAIDISVLYRLNQKHYDKVLTHYNLGYTQMVFIILVFEHEGSNFNDLVKIGCFDKGTVTKSISKLQDMGYVTVRNSTEDKRNKEIFTTDKAKEIIYDLYKIRNDWFSYVTSSLSFEDVAKYKELTQIMINKAMEKAMVDEGDNIKFYRMDKVSFNEYKDHTACVLYTGGCRYRCETCTFKDLVFLNENSKTLKNDDILDYLYSRKTLIDSVVIKGTDPLEKEGLIEFLQDLKNMNLKVKIVTNGFNSDLIKTLVRDELVDCISITLPGSKETLARMMGVNDVDLTGINKTVKYLIEAEIESEFVYTVSEHTNEAVIKDIGKWLKNQNLLVLKNYESCSNSINPELKGQSEEMIMKYKDILKNYLKEVKVA